MDNVYSSFQNSIPPLPGSNPCEPVCSECHFPKEPLTLGISIYTPVSSVPGSASFIFFQPLLAGEVFASMGVLIAAQLFLFFTNRFLGLESEPFQKGPVLCPEQTVRISLSDLQDFLASVSRGKVQPSTGTSVSSADTSAPSIDQPVLGIFPNVTPEIPLVIALSVGSSFANKPFGPTVALLIPVLTFPGVRGALPLLILELLATIFVRAVVPPETTGSKPLTNPSPTSNSQPLQFSPEDLLNLLNRFSKHFGT